jgi:hypothetical protein
MREIEPTVITQGERIEWTKTFCDYPATLYSLEYRFRGTGPGFNVTATVDGSDFLAAVTKENSAACSLGRYDWQSWLTEIATRITHFSPDPVEQDVQRGFATGSTGNVELRSDAKMALDAINAAILGQATNNQMEYEITTPAGSRKIRRVPLADLLAARKEYAAIVARENAAERVKNGGQFGRSVVINVRENR